MKEVRKEVKTEIVIQFNADDLAEVINYAEEQWDTDKVFKNWDCTDKPDIEKKINSWGPFTADELTYIAKYFNYDGWVHCGGYNEVKKAYQMTVYCLGDTLSC